MNDFTSDEDVKQAGVHAVTIGNEILKMLDEADLHENIAQAALGNSWMRLCLAIGWIPDHFNGCLEMMSEEYKKTWERINGEI